MWILRRMVIRIVLLCLVGGSGAKGQVVIAHRGAAGYLPEHTLEAYVLAYGQGADYIEPDLVMTKDRVFICLHDLHLESTTNVDEVHPNRARSDGHWYAVDFTLAEVKSLRVHQRVPERFSGGDADYTIPTFHEVLELIRGLNAATRRDVGIYPELKKPSFHAKEGMPMEEAFLRLVRQYGYEGQQARIFVQCFELQALKNLRSLGSRLPQVLLIGDNPEAQALLSSPGRAKEIVGYANGIGPAKQLLEKLSGQEIVEAFHAHGLVVHPFTFRADKVPTQYADYESEIESFVVKYGVDGVFTDHPDRAVAWRRRHALQDGEEIQ